MAITAQVSEQDRPLDEGVPARAVGRKSGAWPQASQFQRSLPMLRLLSGIASVPDVVKIGLRVDSDGIAVRVVLPMKDRVAASRIYAAEFDYLNATSGHPFDLQISPLQYIPDERCDDVLSGFETIFAR